MRQKNRKESNIDNISDLEMSIENNSEEINSLSDIQLDNLYNLDLRIYKKVKIN